MRKNDPERLLVLGREDITTALNALNGYEIEMHASWPTEELEGTPTGAVCAIVLLPSLDSIAVGSLARLRITHQLPIVLVTRGTLINARRLKDVKVEEVVWLEAVDRNLAEGIECAKSRGFVTLLRRACERAELPPLLRNALLIACDAQPPISTVTSLAMRVGRDRRTLARIWRVHVGHKIPMRLEDFLGWVMLTRASVRKTRGRSWNRISRELKLRPYTLARLARRLAGKSTAELAHDPAEVFAAFVSKLQPVFAELRQFHRY